MAKFTYFKKQKENFKKDFIKSENQKFKEGLSLFGVFKIIVRYIAVFLTVFCTLSAFFIVLSFKYSKTQFYAYGEISFKEYVYGDLYTTVQEDMKTDDFCGLVKMNLCDKGIKHKNESDITLIEIKNGISATHLSDSNNIFVKFYNYDESVVISITNEIITTIVGYYVDGKDNKRINEFIGIGSLAELSYKDIPQLPFYLGFGLFGSLIVALTTCLIIDKARRIISCPNDINSPSLKIISITKKQKYHSKNVEKLNNEISNLLPKEITSINVFPVGGSNPNLITSLIKESPKFASIPLSIKNPITKDCSFVSTPKDNKTAVILLFESGKCSMKNLTSISLQEIEDSKEAIGVFVE